jgi:hypothetical protein
MSEDSSKIMDIETQLKSISEALLVLNDKIDSLSIKAAKKEAIEEQVLDECKKMGTHIDFIENVYNNVKHPLGFLCNKIKYLAGSGPVTYTLTDIDTKLKIEHENE